MNVNIHIPADCLERLLSALERIAVSAERIAGPMIVVDVPKPYPRDMWMESSNAQTRQTELEEALDAAGHGPEHWRYLETIAAQRSGDRTEPD